MYMDPLANVSGFFAGEINVQIVLYFLINNCLIFGNLSMAKHIHLRHFLGCPFCGYPAINPVLSPLETGFSVFQL